MVTTVPQAASRDTQNRQVRNSRDIGNPQDNGILKADRPDRGYAVVSLIETVNGPLIPCGQAGEGGDFRRGATRYTQKESFGPPLVDAAYYGWIGFRIFAQDAHRVQGL
jgi:hypothetical protein